MSWDDREDEMTIPCPVCLEVYKCAPDCDEIARAWIEEEEAKEKPMNKKLDRAREWTESVGNIEGLMPGTRATVEVIQSLPDQWVDAEEVRKVTDRHNDLIVDFLDQIEGDIHTDTWEAIRDFMCELNVEVDTLAIPNLPTLADMTEEERAACRWMQADVKLSLGGNTARRVIAHPGSVDMKVSVWTPYGGSDFVEAEQVTPLPDLPKLKWPGAGAAEPPALPEGMRLADHKEFGRVVVSPKMDVFGSYKIFHTDEEYAAGAVSCYVPQDDLTFLDAPAPRKENQ